MVTEEILFQVFFCLFFLFFFFFVFFVLFFLFLTLAAIQPFCPAEQNNLSNFGIRPPKEPSYKDWLKSAQKLRRKCRLKFVCFLFVIVVFFLFFFLLLFFLFLALTAILCSGTERSEQFW